MFAQAISRGSSLIGKIVPVPLPTAHERLLNDRLGSFEVRVAISGPVFFCQANVYS